MAGASMTAALRQVDRLFREGTLAALTDDEALGRYLDHGDEDAFAALVSRHGPMVLRACLDVLPQSAAAGRLCVSEGVIRGRLARGRAMLRDRLRRRARTRVFDNRFVFGNM
jgi:hypothetical protein